MPASTNQDALKNIKLLHNGAEHILVNVLAQASASNLEIEVKLDQIGPVPGDDLPQNVFLMEPHDSSVHQLPLVLYKYQGRFHPIVGQALVARARDEKQTVVKGLLLSTPALKKARIIKPEEVVAPPPLNPVIATRPQRPERRYEFDGKTTRSYGGNSTKRFG